MRGRLRDAEGRGPSSWARARAGALLLLWLAFGAAFFGLGWPWELPATALLVASAWIAADVRRGGVTTRLPRVELRRATARVVGMAIALLTLLIGGWLSLFAMISATAFQSPDPDPGLDGDPCCWHPDTWSDVVIGGVYFVVIAFVALSVLAASALLAAWALRGRAPPMLRRRKYAVRRLAAAAVLCTVAVPISWVLEEALRS